MRTKVLKSFKDGQSIKVIAEHWKVREDLILQFIREAL